MKNISWNVNVFEETCLFFFEHSLCPNLEGEETVEGAEKILPFSSSCSEFPWKFIPNLERNCTERLVTYRSSAVVSCSTAS